MTVQWWPRTREGDLIAYLADDELQRLFDVTELAEAVPGDVVLHKGSPARSLILIESGELDILDDDEDAAVLDTVGPGEVVGEVGFLDGMARTHDVRARTACRLRRLTRERLLALVRDEPLLFAKLTISLAELVARRFRRAVTELDGVRSFAAGLHEPEEFGAGDGAVSGGGGAPPASGFSYDEIDEPLPENALEMLRDVARRAQKDVAGV